MFPLSTFKKSESSLKRSSAVWDLTQIPPETPLEVSLNIRIRIDNTANEKTVQLSCDSMMVVRRLKQLIEPHAYALYINTVDPVEKFHDRNIRYYARTASPTSPRSPDSDYLSEDEENQNPRLDHDIFLRSMEVKQDEKVLSDTTHLYQHGLKSGDNLTCCIDLQKLILQ